MVHARCRQRRDALVTPQKPHVIGRRRLYRYRVRRKPEHGSEVGTHCLAMRCDPDRLSDDRRIDGRDSMAESLEPLHDGPEQAHRIGVLPMRVTRRKQLAEVAERHGSQQRIADRVGEHIPVRRRVDSTAGIDNDAGERHMTD